MRKRAIKKQEMQNDSLEQLFVAARRDALPIGDFRQRVMSRFLVPPSRNMYRIPTFATAAASVLLIVWMSLSGFDVYSFTERLSSVGERITQYNATGGIRLIPFVCRVSGSAGDTKTDGKE